MTMHAAIAQAILVLDDLTDVMQFPGMARTIGRISRGRAPDGLLRPGPPRATDHRSIRRAGHAG
jgi:hypothetical protein